MSRCGYYKIHKGIITCTHPENGEWKTTCFNRGTHGYNECESCRRLCGGIYPSEIPKVNKNEYEYDIIDSEGKVIG